MFCTAVSTQTVSDWRPQRFFIFRWIEAFFLELEKVLSLSTGGFLCES